jgi:hypothetical protein
MMNNIHLILDVDETLVHTFTRLHTSFHLFETLVEKCKSQYQEFESKQRIFDQIQFCYIAHSKLRCFDMVLVLRPGVRNFLYEMSGTVGDVSIWSAGESRYVKAISRFLFSDVRIVKPPLKRPLHVFDRAECDLIIDGQNNPTCTKPLSKIPLGSAYLNVIMDNCQENIVVPDQSKFIHVPHYGFLVNGGNHIRNEIEINKYIKSLEEDSYFMKLDTLRHILSFTQQKFQIQSSLSANENQISLSSIATMG